MSLLDEIKRVLPEVTPGPWWSARGYVKTKGDFKSVGKGSNKIATAKLINGRNDAYLMSLAPKMGAALLAADEMATDMMICIGNIRDAAKTDPRWDGVADKLNARLTAYRAAIEAT